MEPAEILVLFWSEKCARWVSVPLISPLLFCFLPLLPSPLFISHPFRPRRYSHGRNKSSYPLPPLSLQWTLWAKKMTETTQKNTSYIKSLHLHWLPCLFLPWESEFSTMPYDMYYIYTGFSSQGGAKLRVFHNVIALRKTRNLAPPWLENPV